MTEERVLQSEKLAAVGQLAAGVMHEINNPLATIGACVAAIETRLDRKADPMVEEYLDIIEAEVHRCTRIVDQLLDFSRPRAEAGHRDPNDLNALVDQTLFLLKHHQRFKRVAVEREFQEELPPVLVDGERVVQAFLAILLNAADAMPEGERIMSVRTARQLQSMLELAVSDTGTGRAAEVADYRVPGKTGTVRKLMPEGYSEDKYVAWFAGFAPIHSPRLVMVITVDPAHHRDRCARPAAAAAHRGRGRGGQPRPRRGPLQEADDHALDHRQGGPTTRPFRLAQGPRRSLCWGGGAALAGLKP